MFHCICDKKRGGGGQIIMDDEARTKLDSFVKKYLSQSGAFL